MKKIFKMSIYIIIASIIFITNLSIYTFTNNTSNTVTNPTISYARIDTDGNLTIHIKNMKTKPEILINDKKVNAKAVGQYTFEVVDKSLINTTAKITLKFSKDYIISKSFYLSAGKEFNYEVSINDIENIQNAYTDGKYVYMYGKDGSYYKSLRLGLNDKDNTTCVGSLSRYEVEDMLNYKYNLYLEKVYKGDNTDFVFINGIMYTIFSFDLGSGKKSVLAYFNEKTAEPPEWKKLTNLPNDCNVSMPTLAVYNGNLYVIGGYNERTNTISKSVYEYNLKTKKWTKKDNLPGVRFAATANQVEDKLVLSFGGKSDGNVPCNLIYDGKSWKKSKASIDVKTSTGKINGKKYYKPSVGIVSGGLIYSGLNAEKIGNTFYYDIVTDTFKSSGYKANENTIGVAVGNKYYIIDKNSKNYNFSVKSIPVKSGLSKLTVRYPSTGIKAWVNGNLDNRKKSNDYTINTYYYMPGDEVGFKLSDIPGYYYSHFKVDGKEVNGYLYNGAISTNKEIKVTKAATDGIIKLNKYYSELSMFNTLQLKATFSNKNCTPMKWETSDTNCVIVTSDGLVTPTWKSLDCGATIKGTTTINGRNLYAQSKIKIIEPFMNDVNTICKRTSITLNWYPLKGADGYKVYKYDRKTDTSTLYKTITTSTITISGLKPSTDYYFLVGAYKKFDKYHTFNTIETYVPCKTTK